MRRPYACIHAERCKNIGPVDVRGRLWDMRQCDSGTRGRGCQGEFGLSETHLDLRPKRTNHVQLREKSLSASWILCATFFAIPHAFRQTSL